MGCSAILRFGEKFAHRYTFHRKLSCTSLLPRGSAFSHRNQNSPLVAGDCFTLLLLKFTIAGNGSLITLMKQRWSPDTPDTPSCSIPRGNLTSTNKQTCTATVHPVDGPHTRMEQPVDPWSEQNAWNKKAAKFHLLEEAVQIEQHWARSTVRESSATAAAQQDGPANQLASSPLPARFQPASTTSSRQILAPPYAKSRPTTPHTKRPVF